MNNNSYLQLMQYELCRNGNTKLVCLCVWTGRGGFLNHDVTVVEGSLVNDCQQLAQPYIKPHLLLPGKPCVSPNQPGLKL